MLFNRTYVTQYYAGVHNRGSDAGHRNDVLYTGGRDGDDPHGGAGRQQYDQIKKALDHGGSGICSGLYYYDIRTGSSGLAEQVPIGAEHGHCHSSRQLEWGFFLW